MIKEMDKNENRNLRVVSDNNLITAHGLEKLSLKARKFFLLAAAQCKMRDDRFYRYSISVKDFAEIMEIDPSNVYQEADAITDELTETALKIAKSDKSGKKFHFDKYPLTSVCSYTDDKELIIELNPRMTDFLLQLRGSFTQPLLDDFMRMKSPYSMSIWHLMQREMKSNKPYADKEIRFYLSLDEMRQVTGTTDKLKQLVEFKRNVLDKAIREIKDNTGVIITYKNRKQSRAVIGFEFLAVGTLYDFKPDPETAERWKKLRDSFKDRKASGL